MSLRHIFNYLIFLIGSFYFFLVLRNFYNFKLSLLGLIFLILSPRIFAESFYNNKDIVFLSFFCISTFYGFNFLKQKTLKELIKFSIFSALATGVRLAGLLIPVLIMFFYIIQFNEKNKKKLTKNVILYSLIILFFTYLFYPFVWENPFLIVDAILKFTNFDWSGSVYYFGKYEIAKNMPWHYSIIMIISTSPILVSLLFFFGLYFFFYNFIKNFINLKINDSLICKSNIDILNHFSFYVIFITLFIIIELNSTVYGGWRQIYYIYPSIICFAIYGFNRFINFLKNKDIIYIFTKIYILYLLIILIIYHPYQYVFYNLIFSKFAKNNFEYDYWGVSNYDILKSLDKIKKKDKYKIFIYSVSPYEKSLNLLNQNLRNKYSFSKDIENAEYLVTNHYYQNKIPATEKNYLDKNFNILDEIKINDKVINSIYEKK